MLAGTVPSRKNLVDSTVPFCKNLVDGTVPAGNHLVDGTSKKGREGGGRGSRGRDGARGGGLEVRVNFHPGSVGSLAWGDNRKRVRSAQIRVGPKA